MFISIPIYKSLIHIIWCVIDHGRFIQNIIEFASNKTAKNCFFTVMKLLVSRCFDVDMVIGCTRSDKDWPCVLLQPNILVGCEHVSGEYAHKYARTHVVSCSANTLPACLMREVVVDGKVCYLDFGSFRHVLRSTQWNSAIVDKVELTTVIWTSVSIRFMS